MNIVAVPQNITPGVAHTKDILVEMDKMKAGYIPAGSQVATKSK